MTLISKSKDPRSPLNARTTESPWAIPAFYETRIATCLNAMTLLFVGRVTLEILVHALMLR